MHNVSIVETSCYNFVVVADVGNHPFSHSRETRREHVHTGSHDVVDQMKVNIELGHHSNEATVVQAQDFPLVQYVPPFTEQFTEQIKSKHRYITTAGIVQILNEYLFLPTRQKLLLIANQQIHKFIDFHYDTRRNELRLGGVSLNYYYYAASYEAAIKAESSLSNSPTTAWSDTVKKRLLSTKVLEPELKCLLVSDSTFAGDLVEFYVLQFVGNEQQMYLIC